MSTEHAGWQTGSPALDHRVGQWRHGTLGGRKTERETLPVAGDLACTYLNKTIIIIVI